MQRPIYRRLARRGSAMRRRRVTSTSVRLPEDFRRWREVGKSDELLMAMWEASYDLLDAKNASKNAQ
eukprot:IDg2654t1